MTLDGGALHVMFDATQATHFFATSGTTGASVHQQRHWGAVSCTLFGAIPVQHQDSAVHVRGDENEFAGHLGIVCGDAATQRPQASVRQRNRFFHVVIRHHRAHRTKGFHFVHGHSVMRTAMLEQHGGQEGAVFRVVGQHVGLFVLAKEPLGFLFKARDLVQHVLNLGFPNQRAHADAFF